MGNVPPAYARLRRRLQGPIADIRVAAVDSSVSAIRLRRVLGRFIEEMGLELEAYYVARLRVHSTPDAVIADHVAHFGHGPSDIHKVRGGFKAAPTCAERALVVARLLRWRIKGASLGAVCLIGPDESHFSATLALPNRGSFLMHDVALDEPRFQVPHMRSFLRQLGDAVGQPSHPLHYLLTESGIHSITRPDLYIKKPGVFVTSDVKAIESAIPFNLGVFFLGLDKPRKALGYFNQAKSLFPNDSDVHNGIAACHIQLGRLDEARKAVTDAFRLNPHNPTSILHLTQIRQLENK